MLEVMRFTNDPEHVNILSFFAFGPWVMPFVLVR